MGIDELREEVDGIDAELIRLVDRRLRLAREINRAKHERGLPIRDMAREREIVKRAGNAPLDSLTPADAAEFIAGLLELNRKWVRNRMLGRGLEAMKVAVVGLGLIGGSLAKALKRANAHHRLTGVDLEERLEAPRAGGLFDELYPPEDGAKAVAEAEVVFLCTPAGRTLELLERVSEDALPAAIVTDVAGVKAAICDKAAACFGEGRAYFVGGHPMAGKARPGFANSDADLFNERPWVLTPGRDDPVERLQKLQRLIESTGANLQLLLPDDHDKTIAAVSHLPQLTSTALMLTVGGRDRGLAGSGLMDMTRLAESPAGLWNELIGHVRDRDIGELQRLRAYLTELEIAVTFNEPLDKWFDRAGKLRRKLEKGGVAARDTGE